MPRRTLEELSLFFFPTSKEVFQTISPGEDETGVMLIKTPACIIPNVILYENVWFMHKIGNRPDVNQAYFLKL
jgi:hypothetical protein